MAAVSSLLAHDKRYPIELVVRDLFSMNKKYALLKRSHSSQWEAVRYSPNLLLANIWQWWLGLREPHSEFRIRGPLDKPDESPSARQE